MTVLILVMVQGQPIMKREDKTDRAKEAQAFGVFRGLALPDLFGLLPTHPLGGQAPDAD